MRRHALALLALVSCLPARADNCPALLSENEALRAEVQRLTGDHAWLSSAGWILVSAVIVVTGYQILKRSRRDDARHGDRPTYR